MYHCRPKRDRAMGKNQQASVNEPSDHKQITRDMYRPERQRIMEAILHDGICKYSLGGPRVDKNQLSKALRKIAFHCQDENLSQDFFFFF